MSMIANLLRVTAAELESYLQDPSLLEKRVYEDESDTGDLKLVDIDKSWDGIIFLLTGKNFETADDPLMRIFFSGQLVDEEQDMGYGPAHYLTAAEVKELEEELAAITTEELSARFDPDKMQELNVYPSVWEGDGNLDYLLDYFKIVQEVYAEAAKNNEGIIVFIN